MKLFKAQIKAGLLKELLDILAQLADRAKFTVSEKLFYTRLVDSANVSMVMASLKKGAFTEYKAEECDFVIDFTKIRDLLKLAEDNQGISLELKEKYLMVRLENITRRIGLEVEETVRVPTIPQLRHKVKVGIDVKNLTKGMKSAETISDEVKLIATPEQFEMYSQGMNPADDITVKLMKAELKSLECEERSESAYSLSYLYPVVKNIKSPEATLELGTNYPLIIKIKFAEGNGEIEYLLSPRLEEE